MESRSERIGNAEVCTVTHEGREFSAWGASHHGRHVTAYWSDNGLTSWDGKRVLLACRQKTVKTYRVNEWGDEGSAVVFKLRKGRYIIGYALDAGLFRGQLEEHDTEESAAYSAREEARIWMERDEEAQAQDDYEASLED